MIPVLKWAGGKRQIIERLDEIINPELKKNNKLYEPFVGGGSVFLSLEHNKVVINDANSELINTYEQIRDNSDALIELLKKHAEKHSRDYYYEIRDFDRRKEYQDISPLEKAARTIYLNRTCFNGLYRVNRSGYFNVPMGSYIHPQIVREDEIKKMSFYLNSANVKILCGDFENATRGARAGDVVYFDPPYDYPDDGKEGFVRYTADQFGHDELRRMAEQCNKLYDKGCFVVISNNDTPLVRELFTEDRWKYEEIRGRRMINNMSQKRRGVDEVIIVGRK